MDNNVKIAKQLVRLAKMIVGNDTCKIKATVLDDVLGGFNFAHVFESPDKEATIMAAVEFVRSDLSRAKDRFIQDKYKNNITIDYATAVPDYISIGNEEETIELGNMSKRQACNVLRNTLQTVDESKKVTLIMKQTDSDYQFAIIFEFVA